MCGRVVEGYSCGRSSVWRASFGSLTSLLNSPLSALSYSSSNCEEFVVRLVNTELRRRSSSSFLSIIKQLVLVSVFLTSVWYGNEIFLL